MFCLWCRLHTGKEAIHHLFRSQHCVILLLLHCLLLRFLFAIVFAFVFLVWQHSDLHSASVLVIEYGGKKAMKKGATRCDCHFSGFNELWW